MVASLAQSRGADKIRLTDTSWDTKTSRLKRDVLICFTYPFNVSNFFRFSSFHPL